MSCRATTVTHSSATIINVSPPGGDDLTIQILDSIIDGNTGSALSLAAVGVDIENSRVSNNSRIDPQTTQDCGLVCAGDPSRPPAGVITNINSTFQGSGTAVASCMNINTSSGSGIGAIGTITIRDSSFSGFTFCVLSRLSSPATTLNGDLFANNWGFSAIECWSLSLQITRSRFINNSVQGNLAALLAQQ